MTLYYPGAAAMSGVVLILMANCFSLGGLIGLGALCGIGQGCVDSGGNILTLWEHGENVGPYMQTLHTMFGVGAFLSPLLIHAATSHSATGTSFNGAYYTIAVILFIQSMVAFSIPSPGKPTLASSINNTAQQQTEQEKQKEREKDLAGTVLPQNRIDSSEDGPIELAEHNNNHQNSSNYIEGDNLQNGAIDNENKNHSSINNNDDGDVRVETSSQQKVEGEVAAEGEEQARRSHKYTRQDWIVINTMGSLFAVYVGLEVAFGGFIFTYGVRHFQFTNSQGNFITALFWGMLTLGRFTAIFVSLKMKPKHMLIFAMSGSILGAFLVMASQSCKQCLWAGTAIFGVCMACIYPSCMVLLEGYIVITGVSSAANSVWGSFGEMLLPLMTGNLIQSVGPRAFVYLAFAGAITQMLVMFVASWQGNKTPLAIARAARKTQQSS